MLFFIWLIVGELRKESWKDKPILYMRLINIALFLCGMVGIGRCDHSDSGCHDLLYNK